MKLAYDREALTRFCSQRGIAMLELFASALREQDFQRTVMWTFSAR